MPRDEFMRVAKLGGEKEGWRLVLEEVTTD